jgi:hypothetical protein
VSSAGEAWRDEFRRSLVSRAGRITTTTKDTRSEAERFYESHCFIRTTDEKVVPYRMRQVQREFEADLTGRDIVDKARKHGISTHVACRFYRAISTRPNTAAAMVAHKPDATQELWKIVQLLYRRDPRGLRLRYSSRRELFFEDLNSYFVVLQAGKGSGRAGTYNYLHISELAHFGSDAMEAVAGMVAAVPPRHLGSEITIESTANGEGDEFHRRYVAAVEGVSDYAAHFFPWHAHPEYVRPWQGKHAAPLTSEERKLMDRYGLSLEQIAFRRVMIEDIGEQLFKQEYPLDWEESFLASGRKVFDAFVLRELEAEHRIPPIKTGENGKLLVWQTPRRGRRYVAGVDTSEGVLGGDFQAVTVLDFETMAEVARLRGHWPIHVFARKAALLVNSYEAFVVPEKNNHGHAVLEHWLNGEDAARVPRERLYHHRDYDQRGKVVKRPGWLTNEKTKAIAIADLEEAIRKRHLHARDPVFYREARAYAHLEDGTMGAPPGLHDDTVLAMALALQARKHFIGHVGFSSRPANFGV